MKAAIISDIHDNVINLKKCLNWCHESRIDEMICCGDVTNSQTLGILAQGFSGRIHLVRGNVALFDENETSRYDNIEYYGRFGRFRLAGHRVGLCHQIRYIEEVEKLGPCDIIFYGHTHRPWEQFKGKARVVNPGTLGGMFSKGTFAFWQTKEDAIELKLIERL